MSAAWSNAKSDSPTPDPSPKGRGTDGWAIAPLWGSLGLLLTGSLLIILVISFARQDTYGGIAPWTELRDWLTCDNHLTSLNPDNLRTIRRSAWIAIVTTIASVLLGYPVAYYLAMRAPIRRRNLLLALAVVPFWTSFLVRTYAWMDILRTEGLINTALKSAGLIDQPLDLLYNDFSVLLGLIYGELPFMILPIYASLEKMDRSLLEAAGDLGAPGNSRFWRVIWPLSLPGVLAGTLLVFIPSLGQFVVTDILGGGRKMYLGNLIQNQFAASRNQPFGSAIALQLTAAVMALLMGYVFFGRRRTAIGASA